MSRRGVSRILDLFFPPICPICGEKSASDGCLCGTCLIKYSEEQKGRCPVCGGSPDDCTCGISGISRTFIGGKKLVALTFYRPHESGTERVTERIIRTFKRRYDKSLTDFFAREISGKLLLLMKSDGEDPRGWLVTFPPRSSENRRKYGFDQGEVAVRSISKYTGIPWGKTLVRPGGTEQKELGRQMREENSSFLKIARNTEVSGKKIILFDDVITTGATVRAASEALLDADAECVFPVCIARTRKNVYSKRKEK